MTIEIHNPEVEQIVNDAVLSGRYGSIEAVLSEAVLSWRNRQAATPESFPSRSPGKKGSLLDACAMVRGLTDDADFSRDPSLGRPVDLS